MFLRQKIIKRLPYTAQKIFLNEAHLKQRHASSTAATIVDFSNSQLQKYLESLRQEFYALRTNPSSLEASQFRLSQLSGIVSALEKYRILQRNITSKETIEKETDEDMRQLMKEENDVYLKLALEAEQELTSHMLDLADSQCYPSVIFEVTAGAGGQEAMLFAKELVNMYVNYFEYNDWKYEVLDEDRTDINGLRHANLIVDGIQAFNKLRYEGGVHRVQRVPATEKSGRIHTSTASVAVIPRPSNVSVTIADKDLKIETKRASGAGGQHVNTTDSAVRIVHLPTGIAVESQTERSQIKNREIALKRLQAKLLKIKLESAEANIKTTRKAQQGNLDRNEKIRTYNFVQDRITDHRIQNGTVHNLMEFFDGTEHLDNLIERLDLENRKAKLNEMISHWKDKEQIQNAAQETR